MATRRTAAGTYRLNVNFNGMCLFVPDRAAKKMHVLMPNGKGNPGQPPKHITRIAFDAAHLQPGQKILTGVPVYLDLHRIAVDLPSASASGSAEPSLHRFIAPLHEFMVERVHKDRLKQDEILEKVGVRVTLTAGKCGLPGETLCWNVGPTGSSRKKDLTNVVRWIAEGLTGDTLPLNAVKLKKDEKPFTLATLHPVGNATKTISIDIFHLPFAELPPHVNNRRCEAADIGKDPSHFHGFSDLFVAEKVPAISVAHCHPCVSDGSRVKRRARTLASAAADTGSLLTCMLAASEL